MNSRKLKLKDKKSTVYVENWFSALRLVLAIIFALALAFLLICLVSKTPFQDFMTLLLGPLSHTNQIISVINKAIPLLFTGVAVCLLFSCGQISTACEGSFYFGAVAATIVAIQENISPMIHIPLCLLTGAVVGAVITMLPTWLNVRYRAKSKIIAVRKAAKTSVHSVQMNHSERNQP